MTHPLVDQLRFTRAEFIRGVKPVSDEDGRHRFLPMNCLAWNVGHLAWQEQRTFLYYGQGQLLLPEIDREFVYGAPASTPSLKAMLEAWSAITEAADPWLNAVTTDLLAQNVVNSKGKLLGTTYGNMLQRVIYHYWYHTGENQAIRQLLGHERLPVFVGDIDSKAPYRPE
jgi:hypothetical protein